MRTRARSARLPSGERGGIIFSLVVLFVVVLLGVALYVARAPLLAALGEWWMVSDELEKAQAIVVLGGDSVEGSRVQRAARLYGEGWAPRVVLIGPALRVYLSETELMQREAIALGVPADRLLRVPRAADSTFEEALVLRPLLAEHGFRRVIVVTSSYHARRARRIFRAVYRERGIQIWVDAVDDPRFDPRSWWQKREQRALFFLEILRSLYSWWELRRLPPPAAAEPGCLLLRVNLL